MYFPTDAARVCSLLSHQMACIFLMVMSLFLINNAQVERRDLEIEIGFLCMWPTWGSIHIQLSHRGINPVVDLVKLQRFVFLH